MKKAKRCLIAVVSGVLVASAVLSGCGQSKKEVSINDDHLTVYLWENRLMKNIAPYILSLIHIYEMEQVKNFSIEQLAALCVGYGPGIPFAAFSKQEQPETILDGRCV